MKSLLLDTFDWEILDTKPGLNTFWCNKDYFKNVKCYVLPCVVRMEILLPFSLAKCAATVVSTKDCEDTDSITKRMTVLKEFDHETCKEMMEKEGLEFTTMYGKRSSYTSMWDFILPFPFHTPRKTHAAYSLSYDPSTSTLMKVFRVITTPESDAKKRRAKVFTSKTKEEEKDCYFSITTGAHHLQKIDDNKTLYKYTALYSPMGWAQNKALQRIVSKKFGENLQKMNLKFIPKKSCETWQEVIDILKGDPVSKMLQDLDIPKRDQEYLDSLKGEKKEEKIEVLKIEESDIITIVEEKKSSPEVPLKKESK